MISAVRNVLNRWEKCWFLLTFLLYLLLYISQDFGKFLFRNTSVTVNKLNYVWTEIVFRAKVIFINNRKEQRWETYSRLSLWNCSWVNSKQKSRKNCSIILGYRQGTWTRFLLLYSTWKQLYLWFYVII